MTSSRYDNLDTRLEEIHKVMEPFQRDTVKFAIGARRCLIEAPVGAGKTLIGLTTSIVMKPKQWLIVCSKNALYTWVRELNKWFPGLFAKDEVQIVDGSPWERSLQWQNKNGRTVVYICTFGKVLNDLQLILPKGFDVITVDEAHRARNRKAKVFAALKEIAKPNLKFSNPGYPYPIFVELTGTPGDKGVQHMWGYFHLIDPKLFSSYWRFINTYCETAPGRFGMEIIGPKNTAGFANTVAPYFRRITVEETKLEKVRRHVIPLKMSPNVAKVYQDLENDMMSFGIQDGDFAVVGNSLARTIKLRQLLTCPQNVIPSLGIGDLLPWIVDKINDDDSGKMRHSIIFTPFRPNLQVYEDYLRNESGLKPSSIVQLHGEISGIELRDRVQKCNDTKGIALCTTLFAQSFEFPKMGTAFMAGYEWSKDAMEQAEGRIRRLISEQIANAYYLQFMNTIDEDIMNVLDGKTIDLRILFQNIKKRESQNA